MNNKNNNMIYMTLALHPPIDHRSMEDHYTEYFWLMDPPFNWAWSSGRPLHCTIFMKGWPCPSFLQLTIDPWKTIILNTSGWYTPCQSSMDLWKIITPNNFHDKLTPPPPIDHRSMEDHYTTLVSHIAYCTDTLGRLMGCNGVAWIYGWLAREV